MWQSPVYCNSLENCRAERHREFESHRFRQSQRRSCMSSKETLDKAYGNMPKEVGYSMDLDFIPTWRGIKYYWYKLIRKVTR